VTVAVPRRALELEPTVKDALSSEQQQRTQDEKSSKQVEPLRIARRDASAAFEREYVQRVLEKSGGNITRAAALAEVSRQMIQKLMRKYGL
jgi:transcriptional regulator with GAF, ATPase, and Fis domain